MVPIPTRSQTRYRKAKLTRSYNQHQRVDEADYGDGLENPTWSNTRLDAGYVAIYGESPTANLLLPGYKAGDPPDRMELVRADRGNVIKYTLELSEPEEGYLERMQSDALAAMAGLGFANDSEDYEQWSHGVVKQIGSWPREQGIEYKETSELEKTFKITGTTYYQGRAVPPGIGAISAWQHREPALLTPEGKIHGAAGPFPAFMWALQISKVLIRRPRANATEFRRVNSLINTETSCQPDREFTGGIMSSPTVTEPEVIVGVIAYPPYTLEDMPELVPPPSCFTPPL